MQKALFIKILQFSLKRQIKSKNDHEMCSETYIK